MRIEKWCVISRNSALLQPPEQERFCLHGFVVGHPRCVDGKEVTTSLVISRNGTRVVTKSGSQYELGEVDGAYECLFPNARRRLLGRLASYNAELTAAYEI